MWKCIFKGLDICLRGDQLDWSAIEEYEESVLSPTIDIIIKLE